MTISSFSRSANDAQAIYLLFGDGARVLLVGRQRAYPGCPG